jgi:hypothetical protein
MLEKMINWLNKKKGIISIGYTEDGWQKKSFFMDDNGNVVVNEIACNEDGSYVLQQGKYPAYNRHPVSPIQALELMKEKITSLNERAKNDENKKVPDNSFVITDGRYYFDVSYDPPHFDFLTTHKSTASKLTEDDAKGWLTYVKDRYDVEKELEKFKVVSTSKC